jgi:hypothetical protein
VISFETIRGRAERRKGGPVTLSRLLPPMLKLEGLAALKGDGSWILLSFTNRAGPRRAATAEQRWDCDRTGRAPA